MWSTFAGGEAVDYSRRLGLLAIARRGRLEVARRARHAALVAQRPGARRALRAGRRRARRGSRSWPGARSAWSSGGRRADHRLGRARDVAPAWRPGLDQVAFVRPDGEVVVASGTGRLLAHCCARAQARRALVDGRRRSTSWSRCATPSPCSIRASRVEWSLHSPAILSAVAAPVGTRFALLTVGVKASGAPHTTLELRDARSSAVAARGSPAAGRSAGRVVWSPDARIADRRAAACSGTGS